ncbi:alpha/beta hydrolase [Shewanella youngdeokensis]|uniref:Alpha/beta fold hydrolase n=1 Tax=Shewanella youngdeokensis TaxID=2999068 RepID=A0ABZ0K2W6_9GAMM|nr:alpha/beta fold hydrolase [Shewanella sp. DAU334]
MIKKTLLAFTLIAAISLLAVAWYFSTVILHLSVYDCNPEHYVFCGDPSTQGIAFEEVSFTSEDGFTLPGWYMASSSHDEAILLVHGRGANRTEGMRYAKPLIAAGYNVLAFDMRHPRQDPAIISTMGYFEQKDVVAALNYLENDKHITRIGLMGFSMGATTGIIVMAKDARVRVGVFSGGYANSMDVLADQARNSYGLPRYPLLPIVEQLFAWRGNVNVAQTHAENYIGQISPRPVYIMHGTADETVDFSHGQRLYSAAQQPKQFWQAQGGRHTRLWQHDTIKAETSVVKFFTDNL